MPPLDIEKPIINIEYQVSDPCWIHRHKFFYIFMDLLSVINKINPDKNIFDILNADWNENFVF